ncbi:MAG: LptA/OstA family protein, partial [Actinomycetota bacterium]
FDEALGMVVASGNVEISQGDRILRADRVTYNQRTDIVTATGNIVLAEPSGEVIFADYAELQGDLADGFVRDLGILFTDNSRVAANAGLRRAGRVTEAERGQVFAFDAKVGDFVFSKWRYEFEAIDEHCRIYRKHRDISLPVSLRMPIASTAPPVAAVPTAASRPKD